MKLLQKYQQAMYCMEQFGSELGKPMRYYTEFVVTLNYLATLGIVLTIKTQFSLYITILLITTLLGWILVRFNNAKINNSIRNKQNPELMEILKLLKEIKNESKSNISQ